MGKVIVLSGISGSGKSTFAKKLKEENEPAEIVSADNYFLKHDGSYEFNPKMLSDAHGECFHRFITFMRNYTYKPEMLIVDNTNILSWEIAPYMLAARAFGWDAEIITLMCPEAVAAARNVHGLDAKKINEQQNKLLRRWLPKNWPVKVIEWRP